MTWFCWKHFSNILPQMNAREALAMEDIMSHLVVHLLLLHHTQSLSPSATFALLDEKPTL